MRARFAAVLLCCAVGVTIAPPAAAQTIRDGDDFSVDVTPAEGHLCMTFPESMKDMRACQGVEDVPPAGFATVGTNLLAVAYELTGDVMLVLTVAKTKGLSGPVRPSAIDDVVHGAALSIQGDGVAKILDTQHGPIDATPPNAPNAWWRVDASVGESGSLSALGHVFYGKDSAYSIKVLAQRSDISHAVAWKDKVVPTVRVRAPAPFTDVEEDRDPNVVVGRWIGVGLVGVAVAVLLVMALRKRKPRPPAYGGARPPHE